MHPLLSVGAILALFLAVGALAGVVVGRARKLGAKLGIGTFFLGVLLGLFTSAPEATIAANAAAAHAVLLSVGNLFGGTAVLFGLIAAALALRAGSLPVREGASGLFVAAAYLLAPMLLALDGTLSALDGLVLGAGYVATLGVVYAASRKEGFSWPRVTLGGSSARDIVVLLGATALIALCAGAIVRLTVPLAAAFGVPELVIGVIAYGIGTNLPELAIALRASRRPDALPVATLLGSAAANPFLLGLLALSSTEPIALHGAYLAMAAAYVAIVVLFFLFARTGRRFTRQEGACLLLAYALFLILSTQTS